jgi:phage FluMu protein Com
MSIGSGPTREYNCKNCGRLLMTGLILNGHVDKDCDKCGQRNRITFEGIVIVPKNDKPFQQRLELEKK